VVAEPSGSTLLTPKPTTGNGTIIIIGKFIVINGGAHLTVI